MKKLPPVHPGEVLWEDFIKPLGLSQYRVAADMGMAPLRISQIVRGQRAISADTALRLARYLGTTPGLWLRLQARYDLAVAQARSGKKIERQVRKSDSPEKRQDVDMATTIQVGQRGTLTLPAQLRERYKIKAGDRLSLVDLDGMLVLTPMVPMVPKLAREIEWARIEAGLSLDELLAALRAQRERYGRDESGAPPE